MDPWISWLFFVGIVGAGYWYYTQSNKPQPSRVRSGSNLEGLQPPAKRTKKEERAKRKPINGATVLSDLSGGDAPFASAREGAGSNTPLERAVKQKTGAASKNSDPTTSVTSRIGGVEAANADDDRRWAQQMNNVRQGTNLSVPAREGNRTKTVKSSAKESSQTFSSASSTGGVDADDDLSPAVSPTWAAASGDVTDMLEPKSAGPSILRLTEPVNAVPQRAPRPQKEFQAAETKKQRQNRRKNEERKAANQETEQQRKVFEEAQRRAAREARGEPAKNGLQQAKAPTSNAWKSSPQTASKAPQIEGLPVTQPLLDTFDRSQLPAVGNAQASVVPISGGLSTPDLTNGLSEEEQMSMLSKLSEDESGWNTVATKKGKKPGSENQGAKGQTASAGIARAVNGYASLPDED